MPKSKHRHSRALQLVWDRRYCQVRAGDVEITAAPDKYPPFEVYARAEEQDSFLLLSEQNELYAPEQPAWVLANQLSSQAPHSPGSVVVRGQRPVRLSAIIYDVEQEPLLREEWIVAAVKGIFRETERRRLPSLALPVLGARHGHFNPQRFAQVLSDELKQTSLHHLKRLWLVIPEDTSCDILNVFRIPV